ncbi:hypothetical protein IE53DRAFT_332164 [Violaceomyces palustris]|uniref:Uncharacterized protein n=1 Tax=Violaceomyces palustris TaxID=1673888 RepID=A0ACD0NUK5_9BASI|nr:hypothetical protein IE53DRAFT_332164 [Violaceomyces palustris]
MSGLKSIFRPSSSSKDSNKSSPRPQGFTPSASGTYSDSSHDYHSVSPKSKFKTLPPISADSIQVPAIDVTSPNEDPFDTLNTSTARPRSLVSIQAPYLPPSQPLNALTRSSVSPSKRRKSDSMGTKIRRGSRAGEKSEDGHSRPEVLNRHELMRRAMASANDPLGVESASDEDNDEELNTPTAPTSTRDVAPAGNEESDRPGEGSLALEAFPSGFDQVVSADGSSNSKKREPLSSTPARPSLQNGQSSMPNVVTPSPIRPDPAGSASFQDSILFTDSPPSGQTSYAHFQAGARPTPEGPLKGSGNGIGNGPTSMSKSVTSATLAPSIPDGVKRPKSPRTMVESASTSQLLPGPLSRLRKTSDAGLPNGKSAKKSTGPSGGIASALAASGMAGMGVGNAAVLQQGQIAHAQALSQAAAAQGTKNSRAATMDDGIQRRGGGGLTAGGTQAGVPRDPSTGTVIEKDIEGDDQFFSRHVFPRDRSASSLVSYDGSVMSDRSDASGLGAAAGFSSATAAMLAPIGAAPSGLAPGNINPPTLTPSGIGAVGGLSPSGNGESVGILDAEAAWPDEGPQITGFAVASSKRNNDFHQLFASVPEDDYLIEDYGCALLREILIQGRIYISENHICFNANIFGWVTNVVLQFSEIVSIEKRMTAFVIPNAIQIATLHSKHTFSSFLSRDTTYDLIVNIWRLSHPGVAMGQLPDQVEATDDDTDGEEGEDDKPLESVDGHGAARDSVANSKPSKRSRLRKKLKGGKKNGEESFVNRSTTNAVAGTFISPSRSPGPGAKRTPHRVTHCPCDKEKKHLQHVVLDMVYPTVPEKLYNLIFTSGFMKEFWTGDQGLLDLQMSDWSPNPNSDNMLSRSMSYIKPLTGSFGPKQTKCLLTDENLHVDFDDYVCTMTTTRTPDVPSGSSFSVKTRTCLTWAGGNNTKVYVTCNVEWTGRSMIKGIIDKASIDGQKSYYQALDLAVRKYLQEHTSEFKEEGDDEAAVEEIARAATPAFGVGKGKGASDVGAKPEGEAGDQASQHGSKRENKSGLGSALIETLGPAGEMMMDLGGGAIELVSDFVSGASLSMLALSGVVLLLIASNIWTWRAASSSYRQQVIKFQSGSPGSTSWRQATGSGGGGGGNHDGYAAASSERWRTNEAWNRKGTMGGHEEGDQSAQAIALAVREVLKDFLQPSAAAPAWRGGRGGGVMRQEGGEEVESVEVERREIEALLKQAEERVERLRRNVRELKGLEEEVRKSSQQAKKAAAKA